jgi:hypothetical protein
LLIVEFIRYRCRSYDFASSFVYRSHSVHVAIYVAFVLEWVGNFIDTWNLRVANNNKYRNDLCHPLRTPEK